MTFLTFALVEANSLLKTQFKDFHLIVKKRMLDQMEEWATDGC